MRTLERSAAVFGGERLRSAAVVGLAGLSLGACASVGPPVALNRAPSVQAELLPVVPPPQKTRLAPPPTASIKAKRAPGARTKAEARNRRPGPRGSTKIGSPYRIAGVWYTPAEQPSYDVVGIASWYGDQFNGRSTANGERFDMHATSAAHTTLPLPSIVEVTNLDNGRSLRVRLNDRGPFKPGRIIDLSRGAAQQLGYLDKGLARVRVRYVGPSGGRDGSLAPLYVAQAARPAKPRIQLAAATATEAPQAAMTVPRARRAQSATPSFADAFDAGMQRIALASNDRQAGPARLDARSAPLW